jgi:predicted DNA-binding transcriptional regulator AlpA
MKYFLKGLQRNHRCRTWDEEQFPRPQRVPPLRTEIHASKECLVNIGVTSRKPAPERLLTHTAVARWFGVSAAWVRDHASRSQPRLPVVRLGKLLRFRSDDIEQFLCDQGIPA